MMPIVFMEATLPKFLPSVYHETLRGQAEGADQAARFP